MRFTSWRLIRRSLPQPLPRPAWLAALALAGAVAVASVTTTATTAVTAAVTAAVTPVLVARAVQNPADTVGARCDLAALRGLALDGARVTRATLLPAGPFTPPGATRGLPDLPAFCRVEGEATAATDSRILFEAWIPAAGWNGKIVTTGNGGYSNALSYRDMANALAQGYAAVGGDTGHQAATDDLLWGQGHPERIKDWGTRSVHAITVAARGIVAQVGGRPSRRAYFYGCSTGGHQGYAEMQRYPDDFDGVIAGAPGNNRVRLNVGFLWQFLANRQPGSDALIVPASKLPLVTRAAVAACDANDGVTDGIVDDPRTCRVNLAALQCGGADEPGCLTSAQVAALTKMAGGARNPRTGEVIYPGWLPTSEALTTAADGTPTAGWHQYWGVREPTRVNFWRAWVFNDPQWNPWRFDFDKDVALAEQRLGPLVDHTSVDLSAFKAHGGKAIVYQGWQDPVVNAVDTIAYYERLRARQGSQADTDAFFRLFLVAGMGHCGGGPGAVVFGNAGERPPVLDREHDLLMALDAWVEQGLAPERIVATSATTATSATSTMRTTSAPGTSATRTRPLCAYPRRATYLGSGPPDRAESFACR